MKKDNPFTLTSGKRPNRYINRYENTSEITLTFDADHPISQTYLISGIRGSGKTVLMTSVANQLHQSESWIVVDLNVTQPLLSELAMRLMDACKQVPNILEKGFEVSVARFGIGYNGTDDERDSVSKIEAILEKVKKKNKKILITIDEVMADDNMRVFASQFQIFVRKDYPVYLLMTGLYENIYAIQNDPVLTFLLRAPKIVLEPLGLNQIKTEYQDIFSIEEDLARKLANVTMGYAFAFQALGMLYWEYHDSLTFDKIIEKLDGMLEDYVYRKIWSGLSDLEKQIILAMPENNKKIKVKELCTNLSMTSATFSKYRERLLNKGVCVSSEYGHISIALPRFLNIVRAYEIY